VDLLAYASSPPRRGRRRALQALLLAGASMAVVGVVAFVGPEAGLTPRVEPSAPADRPVIAADAMPKAGPQQKPGSRQLTHWLGEIAEESGLGLVGCAELKKEVTAVFPRNMPWEDKLDALAEAAGVSYRIRAGVIEVGPLHSPAGESQAVTPRAATESLQSTQAVPTIASYRPANARAADLAKVLARVLDARGVAAAADSASNSLIVSGPPDAVTHAKAIAADMDVPYRRFLVEAEIVEMLTASRNDLGVQWRIETGDLATAANFPSDAADDRQGELTVATGGTFSLKARISALEAEGRVRVVARPRVLVVEGRPASIESVRILRVRLPDTTSVVAGGDDTTGATSSRAVEEFPVGITLKVEPSLLGGDRVALRVTAKSSTLGEPLPPDDIPEEFSRLVEADFFVSHGETAVLGGLARVASGRRRSGLPLLQEMPLLGVLFGRRSRDRDAEELVVLVTPYLLP
jgi:type II secretory pathway component GspD/PulD (secretin)